MVLRIVAALLLVVAIGLAWPAVRHLRERPPSPTPPVRLSLAAPPGSELGSGDEALDAAISPDDRSMVFVATTDGTPRLWRRAVDADRAESLSGTDGAQLPAWKPTGGVIAFFSERTLKQISLADGVVRDLADASAPAGATWLPDGSLLFSPESRGPIRHLQRGMVMNATTLRTGDRAHVFPIAAAADGSFVYTAVRDDGSRVARLVEPKGEHELITTGGHAQLVGDLLLFIRDNVLLAQRYDPATGVLVGRATSLASGVGVSASGRGLFAASARLLLSATFAPRARALTWLSLEGSPPTTIGEPADYWQARLSPDDRYVALTVTAPLIRTLDIRVVPTTGGGIVEPLTLALAADSDPVWSPDGRRIVFRSLQKGQPDLFVHTAHQTEATDEPFLRSPLDETPTDWSGGRVLFHAPDPKSAFDLWTFTPATGERQVLVKSAFSETDGRWSPDGRWIAYVSDESGQPDVYVVTSEGKSRVRVSLAGGSRPRWRRDGGAILFLRGTRIMRADIDPSSSRAEGSALRFLAARSVIDVPGVRDFDVAHRRDAIVALLPAQPLVPTPVTALVDWRSLLSPP